MLKDMPDKKEKAKSIAEKLGKHKEYLSHEHPIGIQQCKKMGLVIKDLREIPQLRDELWKLYCLIEILFDRT